MIVPLVYALRGLGVKVGANEAVALARALELDLHGTTLDGFYHVARSLFVHREQDLDAFDLAFDHVFKGVELKAVELTEELLEWLKDPKKRREISEEELKMLESLDLEELKRRFEERLREQRGRHDGGSRWIGTGGTSPFGQGGKHPSGMRVGQGPQGAGGGALAMAASRAARGLRGDVTLDTRQIEVALRRLRVFSREGMPDELDVEATIDATAKNAGELDVKTRPPRRSNVKVLLLCDIGGSMDPYVEASEKLFSAARRATHFRKLKTYFFHNCVYGKLYKTAKLDEGDDVTAVMADCGPEWKLVVVGDACMHPSELTAGAGAWTWGDHSGVPGVVWLQAMRNHFRKHAWLNPEPERAWNHPTIAAVRRVFPMFRLTQDGLVEAMHHLTRGSSSAR